MNHFALVIFLSLSINIYGQSISIDSKPEWANVQDTIIQTEVNKYEVQNGFYYTQLDQISNSRAKSYFLRYKVKILNSAGIDYFSQLSVPIDTVFQNFQFHSLLIHRNGQTIDKTNDLKLQLINNEENLEQNVYSGTMLVNSLLKGIRKDDELEISYTINGQNPIFNNSVHNILYLETTNHIDYLSCKILFPKEDSYNFKLKDPSKVSLEKSVNASDSIYHIYSTNVHPIMLEETMSYSETPYNQIEFASHNDWVDVRNWGKELFKYEASKSIDSIYNILVPDNKNIIKSTTDILDFVQNQIRYTSINGGLGSIRPTEAQDVLRNNYGDCKDKVLLTIQLLNKAGVAYAYPALVSSASGRFLNQNLAGHSHFDHVITKAKIQNQTVWLDPTLYLQGGTILDRHSYYFGYALVLDESSGGLELMNVDKDISRTVIEEDFDFSSAEGDASLIVKSILYGKNADLLRNMLDYYSLSDIGKQFKEAYSTIFPEIKSIGKVKIKDDLINNTIHLEENYLITNPWKKVEEFGQSGYILTYEPVNIYNYVLPMSCDDIKFKIDIEKSTSFKQTTRMKLPEDAIYRLNNFNTENNIYKFDKAQKIKSMSATEIIYDIGYKSYQITPDDFQDYCEDVNHDVRNLLLNIIWVQPEKSK